MCTHTTPKEHIEKRNQVSAQVRQFLRSGGKIRQVPTGTSGDKLAGKSYSQISDTKKRGKAAEQHEVRLRRARLGFVA